SQTMHSAPTRPASSGIHLLRRRPFWLRQPGRGNQLMLSAALVVVLASVSLGGCGPFSFEGQPSPTASTSTRTPTATPIPGVTPTPDPDQILARQVADMISHMSLQEELGQLIMVAFNGTTLNSDLRYMITQQHAGGMILYASNIGGYDQ